MAPPRVWLARLLIPAAAFFASATAAHAASGVSSNWSGYVVTRKASATRFTKVHGSWVVPQGVCTAGQRGYSATWVGLGGYTRGTDALEQTGTDFDCSASGSPIYYAWYELVPAASHNIAMTVNPGDQIDAAVTVRSRRVTLFLRNVTRGATFRRTFTMTSPGPDTTSAEWIVEAPSQCGPGRCLQLPLSNFGTIPLASASTTTAGGTTGTISDPRWNQTALILRASERFPSRFTGSETGLGALPSPLSPDGTAFSVTATAAATAS